MAENLWHLPEGLHRQREYLPECERNHDPHIGFGRAI